MTLDLDIKLEYLVTNRDNYIWINTLLLSLINFMWQSTETISKVNILLHLGRYWVPIYLIYSSASCLFIVVAFWLDQRFARTLLWPKVLKNSNFGLLPLWVSKVFKYPKKCLEDLTTFFMSTWWGDSKNMEEIEFSW